MTVTRKLLADTLIKYINREIDLSELVRWAEGMMRENDFESSSFELIRDIVAHIGVADVREFGLTWDDCYDYLHRLGFSVKDLQTGEIYIFVTQRGTVNEYGEEFIDRSSCEKECCELLVKGQVKQGVTIEECVRALCK